MRPEDIRDVRRERGYLNHARDRDGNHLPGGCPECERVEGLEKEAGAAPQLRSNCDSLFKTLQALYQAHGGCGCLNCKLADFLIDYALLQAKAEAGAISGALTSDLAAGPRFEKIVRPGGYPVAQFYTSDMSAECDDHFLLDRETLAGIVERGQAEGKPSYEHERALKALDDAIAEWSQTPWDGR